MLAMNCAIGCGGILGGVVGFLVVVGVEVEAVVAEPSHALMSIV